MASKTPETRRQLDRLMTIAEVADALGVEIRHVRRLVFERRIPYIKWGHLLRFDPADVSAWIDGYRSTPSTDVRQVPDRSARR